MSGRSVLVTGGAGFIGSELVRHLVAAGADVVVVDNLTNGKREHLAEVDADRCRLIVGDIRDEAIVDRALRGVSIVFHLACLGVRHSIHSPVENHAVNAGGSLHLLMRSRAAAVARFVYVSSSEVYGTAMRVPMDEEHPTLPRTVYGASKLAGECYARAFFDTYGFPTVVVRPFNAYGPRCHHEGDSGEVIPKFVLRAMANQPLVVFGDGTQTRDFTYVSDTAAAIVAAATVDAAIGQTINVGSGQSVSIRDLATAVAATVGRRIEIAHDDPRPGDVHDLRADATKAKAVLDFAPTVTLADGLKRLKNWYDASGVSPAALLEHEIVRNWESRAPADA